MDKTIKVLVIVFAILGIGIFGYHWVNQWHQKKLAQAVQQEKTECMERMVQMESEIQKLSGMLQVQGQSPPSSEYLTNVFGSAKPLAAIQPEAVDCGQVTAQVVSFFKYLDSKGYTITQTSTMQSAQMFDTVFRRLTAKPPINVGEMEDIAGLISNVTHLYRVLGKENLILIRDVIKNESAVVEPAMSVLFAWVTACGGSNQQKIQRPDLKALYQYASFFLNTLGGRSYMLRREGKLRMLVNYYAILVIDMSNDAGLNSFGLDIRPHLDYLLYDLNNQKGLEYRERYLTRLAALKDKYPSQ